MAGFVTIKMKEIIVGDGDVLKVLFLMQIAGYYGPTVRKSDDLSIISPSVMPDHLMDVKFYDKVVNVKIINTGKFVIT